MDLIDKSGLSIPDAFLSLIENADIYDSSSSPEANVYFIDSESGYFLKRGLINSLSKENAMLEFLSSRELAPDVLAYLQDKDDWLLTRKAKGKSCISSEYMQNPIKLVESIAEPLVMLHSLDYHDCPIKNRTGDYLESYSANKQAGIFNADHLFFFDKEFLSPAEASAFVDDRVRILETNTLVHGDYCLPNIILQDWKFSSFIDVGFAGVGDRNIDIFWAIWSLRFNFKTDKYTQLFIDAYGKDKVDIERLRLISAIECFG